MKHFVRKGFGKKQKIMYDQTTAFELVEKSTENFIMELKYEKLSFYNGNNVAEIIELNKIIVNLTKSLSEVRILMEKECELNVSDLPIMNNI